MVRRVLKPIEEFPPGTVCLFCKSSEVNILHGEIYSLPVKKNEEITVHYFCMVTSNKLRQKGEDHEGIHGFLAKDIKKELNRIKNIICCYCKKDTAGVRCISKGCSKTFHLPCGIERGSLHQYFGHFDSFCPDHVPKIYVLSKSPSEDDISCIMCTNPIDFNSKCNPPLKPMCCKTHSLMHKICLQSLANHAAYHLKCPLCNRMIEFTTDIQLKGVFVPQRDASWLIEDDGSTAPPQKFCSAISCLCPDGREFTTRSRRSDWYIIGCSFCGQSYIHRKCLGGSQRTIEFCCSDCTYPGQSDSSSESDEAQDSEGLTSLSSDEAQDSEGLTSPSSDEAKDSFEGVTSPSSDETKDSFEGVTSPSSDETQDPEGLGTLSSDKAQDSEGLTSPSSNDASAVDDSESKGEEPSSRKRKNSDTPLSPPAKKTFMSQVWSSFWQMLLPTFFKGN